VATLVIGQWVGEFDRAKADRVLAGELPFDETTMPDDDAPEPATEPVAEVQPEPAARVPEAAGH
jgi:aerobic C4-dicarboxylate transport protein